MLVNAIGFQLQCVLYNNQIVHIVLWALLRRCDSLFPMFPSALKLFWYLPLRFARSQWGQQKAADDHGTVDGNHGVEKRNDKNLVESWLFCFPAGFKRYTTIHYDTFTCDQPFMNSHSATWIYWDTSATSLSLCLSNALQSLATNDFWTFGDHSPGAPRALRLGRYQPRRGPPPWQETALAVQKKGTMTHYDLMYPNAS